MTQTYRLLSRLYYSPRGTRTRHNEESFLNVVRYAYFEIIARSDNNKRGHVSFERETKSKENKSRRQLVDCQITTGWLYVFKQKRLK